MTSAVAVFRVPGPGRIAQACRIGIGFVYLFGAPTHVYFALFNPKGYEGMGEWSPPYLEVSRVFWESWFLPNARYLGLAIAAAELAIALMILGRGRAARFGLVAAAGFHVALAVLFGMWPYTLLMFVGLVYLATLDFNDGPSAWLVRRMRHA